MPSLTSCFWFDREPGNRARGANLAAQGAIVFAPSDPRHDPRSPKSFQAGFGQSGLQAAGRADLHAQAAGRTPLEKLPLWQCPGRADQTLVADRAPRLRCGAKEEHPRHTAHGRCRCTTHAAEKTAPRATPRHDGRRLWITLPWPGEAKREASPRARRRAVEATKTLGRFPRLTGRRGGRAVTVQAAHVALVAGRAFDPPPHERP